MDGVLSSHAFAAPFHRFSVAFGEYFGIQPTFSHTLQVSGATAATMFAVGADSLLTGLTPDLALRSMSESRDQQYEMRRNGSIRLKDDRQREQNGALQTARQVNYFVNQFTLSR